MYLIEQHHVLANQTIFFPWTEFDHPKLFVHYEERFKFILIILKGLATMEMTQESKVQDVNTTVLVYLGQHQ